MDLSTNPRNDCFRSRGKESVDVQNTGNKTSSPNQGKSLVAPFSHLYHLRCLLCSLWAKVFSANQFEGGADISQISINLSNLTLDPVGSLNPQSILLFFKSCCCLGHGRLELQIATMAPNSISILLCVYDGRKKKIVPLTCGPCNSFDGKPKKYCSIKPFSLYVEKSTYSLVKLVDCIGEKVLWGSKQYVSLWRSLPDAYVEIRTDEHLLEWLDMHKESGVVHITAQINDISGPIEQISPTKRRCHPSVRNNPNPDPPCTPAL
ncbi:hypothetical protein EJB05_27659, partial [Eragrostis curvula]